MIGRIIKRLKLGRLRRCYRAGAELSRFIAKDIKRDIHVIDSSELEHGYVTARVRTNNVLWISRGIEPEPFGSPEIVNIDKAWSWDGEAWGGKVYERPRIPLLSAGQLMDILLPVFTEATFKGEIINAEHNSWRIEVSNPPKLVEFVWGPLSGFGGMRSQ
ncbi:hypothetical protein OVA24_14310 [Luteolibacter sp. SL250]|uniref:hypothetical protein n=1 Tax=Luteolibacter sp. SL250 TaxID=2995170 RepID=UPI00226DCECD|nr:hypothetical protein [Luteolibacter sp. SL250]WAC18404.1 hypothetical protein OVA24_14310 [Luteolibacter sp. SL250]